MDNDQIVHYNGDIDYGFDGGFDGVGLNNESSIFSSLSSITIIFTILGIFSFFGPTKTISQPPSEPPGKYEPKTLLEHIESWMSTLWSFVLDPYFLLIVYMLWVLLMFLWKERSWTKGRLRRLMRYMKKHSKEN